MKTFFSAVLFLTVVVPVSATDLTMEQIMSHPDWIATSPENAFIASDSQHVYYQQKTVGKETREWWRASLKDGKPHRLSINDTLEMETGDAVVSANGKRVAYLNQSTLWLKEKDRQRALIKGGDFSQVLTFIGNDKLAMRANNQLWIVFIDEGRWELAADFRLQDEPSDKKNDDFLSQQQRDLFDIIRKREQRKNDRQSVEKQQHSSGVLAPQPFYLGKDREITTFSVSPNGRTLIVGTMASGREGRAEKMPNYVSDDGYLKIDNVRSKVGSDKSDDETLYWVDLSAHKLVELDKKSLPDINRDPLLFLKQQTAQAQGKSAPKDGEQRAVYVHHYSEDGGGVRWNKRGDKALIDWMSYDNKDRWLTIASAPSTALEIVHHLRDAAWINDSDFNEMGWLGDDQSLYFSSEHTGFSQLYRYVNHNISALTQGEYEINNVNLSRDGRWLYFRANKTHPGNHEIYRVSSAGGDVQAVTQLGGENDYRLSADGEQLMLMHSTITQPTELYAQAAKPGAKAQRMTHTVGASFAAISWHQAEIITVPSQHGAKPIYARIYRNAATQSGTPKPAVMFVHGAGYLQNAHKGWSGYFREFMFHNLLLQQGYVVIDMDYRGSAGYGRDWRNAIYQRMGTPELEDYLDGIDYLVANANVDRERIGIYGGSYGGFMTFMALFKTEAFAAGAALRPVSDWAHYNHGYTANILNTPDIDPQAYQRSSPINFAQHLKRPLLICSGMADDNVFFQDSVRLVQRLIELKNPNFEMAIYPIEPHGFREPESWLDEYRRIYKLMETSVKNRH